MRLSVSDDFRCRASRAALAYRRRDGGRFLWARALGLPLLAIALSGAAPPPNPSLRPTRLPANTAVVGNAYSSTYSCTLQARPSITAVCYIAKMPPGLMVDNTPGCTQTSPATVASGGSIACKISGTPTAAGSFTLDFFGKSIGIRPSITGQPFNVAKREPDGVTLVAQPSTATVGQTVTFTATVKGASAPSPTGTVGLYDATTQKTLQTGTLANGTVTFSLPVTAGTTSFSAAYVGDSNYFGKFSPLVNLTNVAMHAPDAVALVVQPNPAVAGQTVTFKVTVTAASGPSPTGTVGLYDASAQKTVQTGSLANGTVTFTQPATKGTIAFSAAYAGDSNYLGKFSPLVSLVGN